MESREIKTLSAAIILQAVADYVDDADVKCGCVVNRGEVMRFFNSSWFDTLSIFAGLGDTDKETILSAILARAKTKDHEKREKSMNKIIERRPGEIVQLDTRGESNELVDRQKRYRQIVECLREKPKQTAKEIAVMMCNKGYIPTSERNFTAPRLTEMSVNGIVEAVGKTKCKYTGRMVAVYDLREV